MPIAEALLDAEEGILDPRPKRGNPTPDLLLSLESWNLLYPRYAAPWTHKRQRRCRRNPFERFFRCMKALDDELDAIFVSFLRLAYLQLAHR